jgi:putative salt-induced outer membrane protein YdiY
MAANKTLILVFACVLLTSTAVRADEVRLKNGDRLTGTVVRMSDKTLTFETPYSGEIKINWSDVAGLDSEAPIRLVLSDDTRLEGRIVAAEEGTLQIASESLEAPVVVQLGNVKEINPEDLPPVRITARVNAGVSVENGNTDTENYNVNGEFTARTEKSRYRVGGEWNEERTDDVDTSKNWLGYADYRYFLTQKWYLFVNTLFENDDFADLNLRTTAGGGTGYQFFESPNVMLSAEVGAAYVDENFIVAEDNSFTAAQWGVDYAQYFFDKAIQLFHRNFGYWSFDDRENWLIKTRQGIRYPIAHGLTATLQYNYDYDNQPSPGAKTDWDSKVLFLLGFQFGE